MSHQLREYRNGGGRRKSKGLADRLIHMGDLSPRLGVRGPKWLPSAGPDREGHGGAAGGLPGDPGLNGHPPTSPTVPTRSDPVHAVPVPSIPAPVLGLDAEQKEAILKHIMIGLGRYGACKQVGVSSRVLCEAMHADKVYGQAIRDAEKSCVDDCKSVIYEQALSGSLAAAVAFCKLENDRAASEEKLRQSGRLVDHVTAAPQIDMRGLDDAAYDRLRALSDRLSRGERIAPEEAFEYAYLMGKSLAKGGPIWEPDGRLAIPHEEIERLFGIDESAD
jgi:hypothetical protein